MYRLFESQLQEVTGQVLQGIDVTKVPGFNRATQAMSVLHERKLAQAIELWADFKEGRVDPFLMQQAIHPSQDFAFRELNRRAPDIFHEAMTTSDFTSLSTYVLDRAVMGAYQSWPTTYQNICKVSRGIRDFRNVDRWQQDDATGLWQKVKERETHTKQEPSEALTSYRVYVYSKGFAFSWEASVNDLLGLFTDLPNKLAEGGVNTLEKWATGLYCDASGPHASFYTAGNQNIIYSGGVYGTGTPNPTLTIDNLKAALGMIGNLTSGDTDDNPISIANARIQLVVGDYNMVTKALDIKNALFGDLSSAPGVTTNVLRVQNWIGDRFDIVFNPWIKKVATSANSTTSWWLFLGGPNFTRPAIEIGFLQGYDTPQLFRKTPNTERLGGGVVPELGDFETRANEYKGLIVFGGTRMNSKVTMASNGSGA